MTMRSGTVKACYDEYIKVPADPDALHKEPTVFAWEHWRLVNNRFPYTKLATAHAMVVLKRNCSIYEISTEELTELWTVILPWADRIYDCTMINFAALRSVNGTPHIHLLTYLPEYK